MIFKSTFLILFKLCYVVKSLDLIPRGVSMAKSSMYESNTEFTCLDGSITIPFIYVNDDYCDCTDGSDEPGTAACPNGLFHCINTGFIGVNIPSSRVNDGICDCCDASDEYVTGNCTDICAILGAEAKAQAEKLAELTIQGNQLRLHLSTTGKQIIQEKQQRIALLSLEKTEAERLKVEAEELKNSAEASESAALEVYKAMEEAEKKEQAEKEKLEAQKEAEDAFKHLDSNSDNRLQIEELTARQTFDQNKDGEVSDEELRFFMEDKNEISWEDFLESMWPRLKPFYMMEKGLFTPPEQKNVSKDYDTDKIDDGSETEEDWEKSGNYEGDKEFVNIEEPADDIKDDIKDDKLKYDEKTQKLIDDANKARTQFESAERAVIDLVRELTTLKDSIANDYGADHEFAPLEGQCFTFSDREYTYKLCPFDQVVQTTKFGGSETRLGNWKSWANSGDYSVMLYDKGHSCWNGPQRSAKVLVSCGLENTVVGATEPNKCEYVLDFKTPAACRVPKTFKDSHDEL